MADLKRRELEIGLEFEYTFEAFEISGKNMSSAKLLIGKTNLLNLHRLQRHNLTLLMLPSLMVCNQSGPTFYASQIGIA